MRRGLGPPPPAGGRFPPRPAAASRSDSVTARQRKVRVTVTAGDPRAISVSIRLGFRVRRSPFQCLFGCFSVSNPRLDLKKSESLTVTLAAASGPGPGPGGGLAGVLPWHSGWEPLFSPISCPG